MTPLAGMPSSLVEEARGSLEWFSIPRPAGIVMLNKIEEKKQKNMSAQRTSREAQKVWRLLQKIIGQNCWGKVFLQCKYLSNEDIN